jgi:hypothetical protein
VGIAQISYGLATAAGIWLPWVSLLFLAAGVIVARRRALALVWASIALALSMILLGSGLGIGRILFISSISSAVPSDAAGDIYDQIVLAVNNTAVSVAVLAIVVAIVAWLAGPFRLPRRLRGFATSGFSWVRISAERHGISTGRFGAWLYAQRVLLRVLIAILAGVIVWFGRPLTTPLIVWTLVLAVVVIAILELLQRPPVEPAEAEIEAVVDDALAADEGEPVLVAEHAAASGEATEIVVDEESSPRSDG